MSATAPACTPIHIQVAAHGDRYFPWCYRKTSRFDGHRYARSTHQATPGRHVFNAVSDTGKILGSADILIAPRLSEPMIETEAFRYGGVTQCTNGPYAWADHDQTPLIIAFNGLWVRPEVRRQGIALQLIEHIVSFGLPIYCAFANPHMQRLFDDDYQPFHSCVSPIQAQLAELSWCDDLDPQLNPHAEHFALTISITAAKRVATNVMYSLRTDLTLGSLLCFPPRADEEDADEGDGDHPLSLTPVADDQRFGYALDWNVASDAPLRLADDSEEDDDAQYARLAAEPVTFTATADVTAIDPDIIMTHAAIRRMITTGQPDAPEPATLAEALQILLVDELLATCHLEDVRDVQASLIAVG